MSSKRRGSATAPDAGHSSRIAEEPIPQDIPSDYLSFRLLTATIAHLQSDHHLNGDKRLDTDIRTALLGLRGRLEAVHEKGWSRLRKHRLTFGSRIHLRSARLSKTLRIDQAPLLGPT